MAKKKCDNCKYSGKKFKISGLTHLHCENPDLYTDEGFESGIISAWDTLREWWDTCDKHEFDLLKTAPATDTGEDGKNS